MYERGMCSTRHTAPYSTRVWSPFRNFPTSIAPRSRATYLPSYHELGHFNCIYEHVEHVPVSFTFGPLWISFSILPFYPACIEVGELMPGQSRPGVANQPILRSNFLFLHFSHFPLSLWPALHANKPSSLDEIKIRLSMYTIQRKAQAKATCTRINLSNFNGIRL